MQMTSIKTVFTQEPTRLQIHLLNNCESKIRTACQQFPDREWSGAAFYKVSYLNGKNKDNFSLQDMRIDVLDFCLQDIGSSTYTEYDLNEVTASYIADHIDTLLGAKVALLHSHNAMKAFFSGTDISTLQEQASQCNNTLSIVVNNDGNYVAKFTQKEFVHQEDDITVDSTITTSYSFIGESNRDSKDMKTDFKKETTDQYVIKIYDCDVVRPLNMPINESFKIECIEKAKELDIKKKEKKYSVENVLLKGTDRYGNHPFSGWLFNDYPCNDSKQSSAHDVDLLTKSILFLSLDIKSLKAPRHINDAPLYHASYPVIESFLNAWASYFYPDTFDDLEVSQVMSKLQTYASMNGAISTNVKSILEDVDYIINNIYDSYIY